MRANRDGLLTLQLSVLVEAWLVGYAASIVHGFGTDIPAEVLARTAVRDNLFWARSDPLTAVLAGRAPIDSVLAPSHRYQFSLPIRQLKAGVAYAGPRSRLRRLVRDLLGGKKPVKLGVVGGSVTYGTGTSDVTRHGWFSVFSRWLVESFPNVDITARNGAVPATTCSFMVMCLEQSVDPDADLIFVEYLLNNGMDTNVVNNTVVQDMERLIRRLLDLPGRPAVVLMQVPTEGMTRRSPPAAPFHDTMEDLETSLAQYYDVQALSLRTALYRLAVLEQRDGFRWRQLFFDHHPGDAGHRMMADLAVFLMQETALDLLLDPMTPEEEAELRRPLPGPMYPGNLPPAAPMCALGPSFAKLVVKTTGFHLTDEGRRKWGYVATAPGAELVVRVDTRRSGGGAAAGDPALLPEVMLFFHYLKSYDHMGRAEIRCVSGCTCQSATVDAHNNKHVSQTYLTSIRVTQTPSCEVGIRILSETSSGEHKFKVSGVVVEESERSGEEVAQMALSDGLLLDIFIPEATG